MITIAVLAVVIGVSFYYFIHNLDSLVKAAIEEGGTNATNTQVKVEKVDISLKKGSGGIYGLSVHNPPGFSEPHVFYLGEISTQIDFESVTEEVVVINDIQILSPKVFVEMNKDNQLNLNELKKKMAALTSNRTEGRTEPDTTDQEAAGEPIKLIIQRLKFLDADISAKLVPLNKEYTLTLPSIELNQLGAPNGATPEELAHLMMNGLIEQVKTAVQKEGLQKELEAFKNKAKESIQKEKEKLRSELKGKLDLDGLREKGAFKGLFEKSSP